MKRKIIVLLMALLCFSTARVDAIIYLRHKVQSDDTIESIAQKFNISKEKILLANGNTQKLKVGSYIYIPSNATYSEGTGYPSKFKVKTTNPDKLTDGQKKIANDYFNRGLDAAITGNNEKAVSLMTKCIEIGNFEYSGYQLGHYYYFGDWDREDLGWKKREKELGIKGHAVDYSNARSIDKDKGIAYLNLCNKGGFLNKMLCLPEYGLFNPQKAVYNNLLDSGLPILSGYTYGDIAKQIMARHREYPYNFKEMYLCNFKDYWKDLNTKEEILRACEDFWLFPEDSLVAGLKYVKKNTVAYYINELEKSDEEIMQLALMYYSAKDYPTSLYYLCRLMINNDKKATEMYYSVMYNYLSPKFSGSQKEMNANLAIIYIITNGGVKKISELSGNKKSALMPYLYRLEELENPKQPAKSESAFLTSIGEVIRAACNFAQPSFFQPYTYIPAVPTYDSRAVFENTWNTQLNMLSGQTYAQTQFMQQNEYQSCAPIYQQVTGNTMSFTEFQAMQGQTATMGSSVPYVESSNTSSSNNRYEMVQKTDTCPHCWGTGKCETCNGKGWYNTSFGDTATCPNCDGNSNGICKFCHGTGKITRTTWDRK